jgi:hypothetical protein
VREAKVKNKYNLSPAIIRQLKVNRDKINANDFWRNDVISAWCLSGDTSKCAKDYELCTYNEYWLGIYDEDAKAYAGTIRVDFSSYGGMCSYNFKHFFNAQEIENDDDLKIQEMFIEKMNKLIDEGVFYFEN